MRDEAEYLNDILSEITDLERLVQRGRDHFFSNRDTQKLAYWGFAVIGEAVKNLPDELLNRADDIPWRSIAGFRDVLVHAYHQIDVPRVWNAMEVDLPVLEAAVSKLLAGMQQSDE